MEDDELGVQEGKKPSAGQKFFQQKYREMRANSPDKHDDLAKSLITTVGMLATIYFGVVTFSKIMDKPGWFKVIAIMPILIWLFAVMSALMGLLPGKYPLLKDVPASVEEALKEITKHKYRCMRYCGWLTLAGLAVMMITLVLYIFNVGSVP
ncbi:hypothetical protein ACFL6S_19230 [Candidatus Poribacteria bacterium]